MAILNTKNKKVPTMASPPPPPTFWETVDVPSILWLIAESEKKEMVI